MYIYSIMWRINSEKPRKKIIYNFISDTHLACEVVCVLIPHSKFLHFTRRTSLLGQLDVLNVKLALSGALSLKNRL